MRVVIFRGTEDWRGFRRLKRGRHSYEVAMSDGSRRRVSFGQLDTLLDGRKYPADFWACVHAADEAAGCDVTVWPSGEQTK